MYEARRYPCSLFEERYHAQKISQNMHVNVKQGCILALSLLDESSQLKFTVFSPFLFVEW